MGKTRRCSRPERGDHDLIKVMAGLAHPSRAGPSGVRCGRRGRSFLRSRHRCVSNGNDGCNVINLPDRPGLMSLAGGIVQQHHGTWTKMALPV